LHTGKLADESAGETGFVLSEDVAAPADDDEDDDVEAPSAAV
jgi:hypothetical protein